MRTLFIISFILVLTLNVFVQDKEFKKVSI